MMMVGEVEKFGVREARATKTAAAARSVEVPLREVHHQLTHPLFFSST